MKAAEEGKSWAPLFGHLFLRLCALLRAQCSLWLARQHQPWLRRSGCVVKLLAPLLLLLGSAGCARRAASAETPWVPAAAPDLGAIVARVGSVPIYSRQVEAQAAGSNSTPREALDTLISSYLLAEKAHRTERFLPEWLVAPELKSALAERLVEREVEPQLRPENVPEQELRALYQNAIRAFVHPRLVDIGLLGVFTGVLMKPAPRLARAETARALAAFVATQRISGPEDFEAIAEDPVWKERNIAYRRVLQGADQPFSRKVGVEVARLRARGDTTGLIEDDDGFFLATYAGERPPENISYTEARESLRQRYYERWRAQRLEQLMRKLAEGHQIESHPQLLQAP